MFDFMIVEVITLLILATTILRSVFSKQKHNLLYSILVLVAVFISFFINMYSETFLIDFANTFKINELYAKFGDSFNSVGMEKFYAVFVMVLFALLVFIILTFIALPISNYINKKEGIQDYYLANNSIGANIVLGVIRGIIYCVIYLALISTITKALDITLSSWLLDLFNDSIFIKVLNDYTKENMVNYFKEVL